MVEKSDNTELAIRLSKMELSLQRLLELVGTLCRHSETLIEIHLDQIEKHAPEPNRMNEAEAYLKRHGWAYCVAKLRQAGDETPYLLSDRDALKKALAKHLEK